MELRYLYEVETGIGQEVLVSAPANADCGDLVVIPFEGVELVGKITHVHFCPLSELMDVLVRLIGAPIPARAVFRKEWEDAF